MSNSDTIGSAELNSETATPIMSDTSDVETLVVVSKVKKFIRSRAGLNTSQCCVDTLTRKVADLVLSGIENARKDGRKTVMGRDIV